MADQITPSDALENVIAHAQSFIDHWAQDDGMDEADRAEYQKESDQFAAAVELIRAHLARKPRVFVNLDGGLVQWMAADRPVDVIVADFDVDGASDDDDLIDLNGDACFARLESLGEREDEIQLANERFAQYAEQKPWPKDEPRSPQEIAAEQAELRRLAQVLVDRRKAEES